MTEDEAKSKWCPMARTPEGNRFAYASAAGLKADGVDPDYIAESVGLFPCLGSACMAWRERPERTTEKARQFLAQDQRINAIKALRESYPDLGLKEAKEIVVDGTRPWPVEGAHGYCGLAGPVQ